MKIIIAGAGAVGTHLAKLLSEEKHDIILMDIEKANLSKAHNINEIITYTGSPTCLKDLNAVNADEADLFIAVTPNESVNITACILASNLGTERTFARIDNYEYLLPKNKELFQKLGVGSMIYPEMLAAKEIVTAIKHPWVRYWLELCNGAINLVGVRVMPGSSFVNKYLYEFAGEAKQFHIVAIKRGNTTLIPKGDVQIYTDDLLFITSTKEHINSIPKLIGKEVIDIKTVMIMGGSRIAIRTCQYLPDDINIKLLETDRDKCEYLLDKVPKNVTIFHDDGRNADFLIKEGIEGVDAFIAVTGNSEANIMSCMVAKRFGVKKTVAEIENVDYISTAENLNIGTIINKKIITVGDIYRFLLTEDVSSVKTFMVANADVAEIVVKPNSKATKKEVRHIKLPRHVTLGGLIRNGEPMMIEGGTQIEPYDHVVVFCLEDSLKEAEKLFN